MSHDALPTLLNSVYSGNIVRVSLDVSMEMEIFNGKMCLRQQKD